MIRLFTNRAALLFILGALSSVFAAQPRIAVLDLFTDENSIRAQAAATNFTALLQAELTKDFQLVERAQLAAAEQELHLSAMTRGNVGSGLKIGKWAKADFLLSGAFVTEGDNRQLEFTFINTSNADAVAKTDFVVGRKSTPLRDSGARIVEVAPAISRFVVEAIAANAMREKQIAVCVLYIEPKNLLIREEEMPKFQNWSPHFEQKTAANPSIRVVRFPEARAAFAESSLMLGGLVESDPDAVTHVADYYIWASGERADGFREDPSGRSHLAYMSRYTINIWDGRAEPRTLVVTNEPDSSALPALAEIVLAELKFKAAGPVVPGVREKVASTWISAAFELSANKYFSAKNLQHRIDFNRTLRVLDLAAFVNPVDPLPHEQALFVRFNGLSDYEQSHRFHKAWAASEAFGAHLDRFGAETVRPFPSTRGMTIATSALQWPAQLLETIPDVVGSDPGFGAPLDASNALKREWRLFWIREMTRRAKKTAHKASEIADVLPGFSALGHAASRDREELQARLDLLEALRPAVAELALLNPRQADGFSHAYSELRKALGLPDAKLFVARIGVRRARLPRFDEMPQLKDLAGVTQTNAATVEPPIARELPRTNEVLAWPTLAAESVKPVRGEYISMPGQQSGAEISALVKSGAQIYVALEQKVESQVEGEARDLRQAFGAATRTSVELFRVETSRLVPAFPGRQFNAQAITPCEDSFMFITSNRLARVVNGQLEFSPPLTLEGIPGITAALGNDFFYITPKPLDQTPELFRVDFQSGATTKVPLATLAQTMYAQGRLLAATPAYVALSRGPLEIFDRSRSTWSIPDLILKNNNSHLPLSERIHFTPAFEIVSHGDAFWICSDRALIYTNTARSVSRRWLREPIPQVYPELPVVEQVFNEIEFVRKAGPAGISGEHTRLYGRPVHVASEGKFAWVALTDGALMLIDPETDRFAQRINIGRGGSLQLADNAVWVSWRSGVVKFAVKPAASIPQNEWTPIQYSPDEVARALEMMRPTERAAMLLMDGEREKARAVLAPKITNAISNTQAIHLFLMALTYDPSRGETKQRAEYLTPVAALKGELGALAKKELERLNIEEPTEQLFARYDTNNDGFLSEDERANVARDRQRVGNLDAAVNRISSTRP